MKKTILSCIFCFCAIVLITVEVAAQSEFKVLATTKTSTAEKEMNEAAGSGFRFDGVSGGETAVGGSEVVIVMSKPIDSNFSGRFQYKLLATKRTSTMQKELQEAGNNGFAYRGQTVFASFFGGQEVVVILEKDIRSEVNRRFEYKLLATSKTSTMQKELNQAGAEGYRYIGLTTGETAFGGKELVVIMGRETSAR